MGLDINQVGSLLGAQKPVHPNVYDLVTGNNREDVTSASLRGLLQGEAPSRLTSHQKASISDLKSYITDNKDISPDDQGKLLASVDALQNLLELTSTSQTQLDPIFSLLSANSDLSSSFKTGSLFDSLA